MDEQRLAEALRGAATDAPPPSFGHADVVQASRRITARRRSALAGGAMAVLILAGVGVAAAQVGTPSGEATSAAAPAEAARAPDADAAPAAPSAGALAAPAPQAAPAPPSPTGPSSDSAADARSGVPQQLPLGPGDPQRCADPQDPALRAIVEQVLPEVVGAPATPTTKECRLGGERGMHVELAGGVLSVEYLPPGTPPLPASAGAVDAPTASGGTVRVSYVGSPAGPSRQRLAEAAVYLAPRL